jgi:hypothetical protein
MCTGPTKTAVVTSTIGIDIDKNNLARRHRVPARSTLRIFKWGRGSGSKAPGPILRVAFGEIGHLISTSVDSTQLLASLRVLRWDIQARTLCAPRLACFWRSLR